MYNGAISELCFQDSPIIYLYNDFLNYLSLTTRLCYTEAVFGNLSDSIPKSCLCSSRTGG